MAGNTGSVINSGTSIFSSGTGVGTTATVVGIIWGSSVLTGSIITGTSTFLGAFFTSAVPVSFSKCSTHNGL
jgi:hypothetical protein